MPTKTTTAAKKPAPKKSTSKKPAVPALKNDGKSAMDEALAALLQGGVQVTPKKSSPSKGDRFEMPLSDAAAAALIALAPLKEVNDQVEKEFKNARGICIQEMLKLYVEHMFEQQTQPQNPSVSATDDDGVGYSGMFMVVAKWHVQTPTLKDGEPLLPALIEFISKTLQSAGADSDTADVNAANLVQNELLLMPQMTLNLTDHIQGRKVGDRWVQPDDLAKQAALALHVAKNAGTGVELTPEQVASLHFEIVHKVIAKPGFLERACEYVESPKELLALLSIVRPEYQVKGAKVCDVDKSTKDEVLLDVVKEVLGIQDEDEEEDA